jgi:hypothetical protein
MIVLLAMIIQATAAWSLPYQLDLHIVDLETSRWDDELFKPEFDSLREVYSQCGIDVRMVEYRKVGGFNSLAKYDLAAADSIAALAKATADVPRPAVYLVSEFIDGNPTPFSRAHFESTKDDYPNALLDTVWYPVDVTSTEYKKAREASPYSALAHELFHILTRWSDHNNDPEPNLMTLYRRRNNHIPADMCARAVTHPAVRTKKTRPVPGLDLNKALLF